MTGAPGSKWSSIFKDIHRSPDIDQTDYTEERTYWHDADTPGTKQLKHTGAYWDPGMEFMPIDWDGPFSGTGKRIIKSHTFAHELEELKTKGYPIILVLRNDGACLEWWKLCGGFNITYPNYQYFVNMHRMWEHIKKENYDIKVFRKNNSERISEAKDNKELCELLEIQYPADAEIRNYKDKNVKVFVYK